MKTDVDFAGVFRTALPKVYISSVELLPTNVNGPKNNVSYDQQSDDRLVKNRFGKRRPRRGAPRFREADGTPKGLKIRAILTIRDFQRNSGRTSWLTNPDFEKYLKINVVLARGRETVERLQDGNFTPRAINRLKKRKKVLQKIMSASRNGIDLLEQRKDIIDGREVYCLSYAVEFDITNYSPRNLSLFACTFINLQEFQLDKTPQINSNRELLQGIVDSQVIINRGDVPGRAEIALLPDGKVWAGPVHVHTDGRLMAGAFHSEIPHPVLDVKQVPNLVIKDYRVLDRIRNADLLLRPHRMNRRKKMKDRKANQSKKIVKDVYITQPDFAFNELNELRFLFHVDYHKIIAEQTQFGACFVNADRQAKKFIIQNTKIKDLTVARHQVKKGLTGNEVMLAGASKRHEIVAQSGDGRRTKLKARRITRSYNPDQKDSEKVTIGGIREIKLGLDGATGIRTFTVSDFEMARKTDGMYTYSVSLEIEDGTIRFVDEQQQKLLQAISAFEEYYNNATLLNSVDQYTGEFSKSFIEQMMLQYPTPDMEELSELNRRSRRRIVQSSIGSAPWLNTIAVYADVLAAVTNAKESDIQRAVLLMESLASPTSGTASGLELVMKMLQDLSNRISIKLGTTVGSTRSSSASGGALKPKINAVDYRSRTPAFKGKLPRPFIKLTKRFSKVHDSNMQNSVGYDFLNIRKRNNLGLRVVTTDQLQNRLSLEHQKYFNRDPFEDTELPKINETESVAAKDFTRFINLQDAYYSYLTPARVMYGKRKLRLVRRGRHLWRTKQYSAMASSLLATTEARSMRNTTFSDMAPQAEFAKVDPPVNFGSVYTPATSKLDPDDLTINVANSITLASMGVTLASPAAFDLSVKQEDLLLGLEGSSDDDLFGVDPRDVLGENTKFATDRLEPIDLAVDGAYDSVEIQQEDYSSASNIFLGASIFSEKDNFPIVKTRSVIAYNPTNENNFVDRRLNKFDNSDNSEAKKQEFMSMLPNQAKSIMLGSDPRVNKNWFEILEQKGRDLTKSSSHVGLNYFNYCHVNQLQVLMGFEKDRFGNPQALKPIYQRLTKEGYDMIVQSGRPFICRMRGFRFADFKKSERLKLPEYNQHFLLVSSTAREALRANREENQMQDNEQEADILDVETNEDSIFVSRLTEYSDLNTTGRQALRLLVFRNALLGDLMPEFTNTTFVQQPKTIARVGTSFASRRDRVSTDAQSMAASVTMPQRRSPEAMPRRRRRQIRTTTQATRTTTQAMTMPRTGGTTGGGGRSGGGY